MIQPVHTCRPDDTLEHALATMKQLRVRRLPVVSDDGQLRGVLSLHDVVDASVHRNGPASEAIVSAMAAIGVRRPAPAAAA